MDGKSGALTAGSGDEVAAQGGASPEWQTRGLSVDGAAGSLGARSRGQELSADTLQRVLPLVLERVEPEGAALFIDVCREWRRELEARGFCSKTVQLCSALARGGGDIQRLEQIALRRLDASSGDIERAFYSEAHAFLLRSWGWKGGLHAWLQASSQEPDSSFCSRGGASTSQSLGLPLVQWAGKPQGRYSGLHTLCDHCCGKTSEALSPDGKSVVGGSTDNLVKLWNAETGAEVPIPILCVEGGAVIDVFVCEFPGGLIWQGL